MSDYQIEIFPAGAAGGAQSKTRIFLNRAGERNFLLVQYPDANATVELTLHNLDGRSERELELLTVDAGGGGNRLRTFEEIATKARDEARAQLSSLRRRLGRLRAELAELLAPEGKA